MMKLTDHFVELLHLGVHRKFLTGLQDLLVLRGMRLAREWVYIALLYENINLCLKLRETSTNQDPDDVLRLDLARHETM